MYFMKQGDAALVCKIRYEYRDLLRTRDWKKPRQPRSPGHPKSTQGQVVI